MSSLLHPSAAASAFRQLTFMNVKDAYADNDGNIVLVLLAGRKLVISEGEGLMMVSRALKLESLEKEAA